MKTKYTPGPWSVHCGDLVVSHSGRAIADCEATPYGDRPAPPNSEDAANARLIAAAPDLLEALKTCEGNISSLNGAHPSIFGPWLKVVREAIAKAEGGA